MRRRNGSLDSTVLSEGRNRTKAQVRLIRLDGETVVEKDYSARGLIIRTLIGPRLLDREQRALDRLQEVRGVPCFRQRPSRDRLIMERLAGRPLNTYPEDSDGSSLPPDFFLRLRRLTRRVHREGVTQGDIGAGDVLVLIDGSPGLVDFSVSVQENGGRLNAWLFRTAVHQDMRRIARLHQRFSPSSLDEDEERILMHETTTHRWSRRLRDLVPGRRRA